MKKKGILRHCDLDLWPKFTSFNRVRGCAAGKQLFSEDRVKIGVSVRSAFCSQTDTHTHTHTHRQTNCNENITPPRFCGGVTMFNRWLSRGLCIVSSERRDGELSRNYRNSPTGTFQSPIQRYVPAAATSQLQVQRSTNWATGSLNLQGWTKYELSLRPTQRLWRTIHLLW